MDDSWSPHLHERGLRKLAEIVGTRSEHAKSDWSSIAPDMKRYIVDFIAGEILSRPGLDSKSRQLITVSGLMALGTAPAELEMHMHGALDLGWTRGQIVEPIIQLGVFVGFPGIAERTYDRASRLR